MIVKFQNKNCRIAALVGILDTAIVFSYLTSLSITIWYAALISAKLIILLANFQQPSDVFMRNRSILAILFLMGASSFLHFDPGRSYTQSIGHFTFFIQAFLSLYLIRPETVSNYCRGAAATIMAATVLYLGMAGIGRIEHIYGRYQFFGDNHPNLGSEIMAVGAVAAAASFTRRNFAIYIVMATLAVGMMQGRAALLTCLLVAMVRASAVISELPTRTRQLCTALLFIAGPIILGIIALPLIENLSSALMLDDEYRGVGTGFVGRDDRWLGAWNLFLESPLIGNGADVFNDRDMHGAHSFALYALACYGMLGVIFIFMLGHRIIRLVRENMWLGFAWLSLIVMLILNDRFLNLNPYPFVAIVMLCAFYGAIERQPASAAKGRAFVDTPADAHRLS